MPGGDKKWDPVAERDLCIAVFLGNSDDKIRFNWPKVVSIMEGLGYNFTKDAISQHFTKRIMKDFKNRHSGDSVQDGPSAVSTPKKAAATPKKKTTPGSNKRTRVKTVDDLMLENSFDEHDDEDEAHLKGSAKKLKLGDSEVAGTPTKGKGVKREQQ